MQGSPSPCFLAPSVVYYMVYGKIEKVETCIGDIPNQKVKQKQEELEKIEDPEAFSKNASFECSFRFKAGFSKPIITFQEKDKLFHAVALHYTLLSSLSEINQVMEELNVHGLLDHLRKKPQQARRLFLYSENQLNAEQVDNLFMPSFSPKGSNKRAAEESVSLNFTRYLEDVESGDVTCKIVDFNTNEESELQVTLPALLQFSTGRSSVPALGFLDKLPLITFQHNMLQAGNFLPAHAPTHCTFQLTTPF